MPIFEDYLIAKLITKIDFRKVFAFSAFTTWEHGEWEKNCLFFLHLQQGERKKKDKNLKNIKIKKNYMN